MTEPNAADHPDLKMVNPNAAAIGKQKAVTARARKIAVLFYNALRHGVTYQDQGAPLTMNDIGNACSQTFSAAPRQWGTHWPTFGIRSGSRPAVMVAHA